MSSHNMNKDVVTMYSHPRISWVPFQPKEDVLRTCENFQSQTPSWNSPASQCSPKIEKESNKVGLSVYRSMHTKGRKLSIIFCIRVATLKLRYLCYGKSKSIYDFQVSARTFCSIIRKTVSSFGRPHSFHFRQQSIFFLIQTCIYIVFHFLVLLRYSLHYG